MNEFSMTSTGGYVRTDVDPPNLGTILSRAEVRMISLAHSIAGAIAITPWLGIEARLTGTALVPKTLASAVVVGAYENLGADGTLVVELYRQPDLIVTARGGFSWSADRTIQPSLLPASILSTGTITSIRPSVAMAFAPARGIGVQASLAYNAEWFDELTDNVVQSITGAAAVTIQGFELPITTLGGVQVSHEWGRDFDVPALDVLLGNNNTQERVEVGVFYTGRRNLDLGAELTFQFSGSDDRRLLGDIRFGYYF